MTSVTSVTKKGNNTMDIQAKINEAKRIDTVASVSWKVTGGYFTHENVEVVLVGANGYEWSVVIHSEDGLMNKFLRSEEEAILNAVLSLFGLIDSSFDDLPEVINQLRKKYPYKETFFVNEAKCQTSFFEISIHRF